MTTVDDLDRFEAYIRSAEDPVALDAALEAAQRLASFTFEPLPHQVPPPGDWSLWLSMGGRRCVAAGTLIDDPTTGLARPIESLTEPHVVQTLYGPRAASPSFRKGVAPLYRVVLDDGREVTATMGHRFLTMLGWEELADIDIGDAVAGTPSWGTVAAIEPRGEGEFYDLTVPDAGHYLAHGIWHHNSGKTNAVTAWLDDHMLGPPCDPRVPGGHRAGIIAPTFGDAVESVVNGPSGLRAINPDVSMVSERGGALAVVWPNGARGRVFGAHTRDDVDRLRAGGGRCLVASTSIATRRGSVPLDAVGPADEVWTRNGWRPVAWARQTGEDPTWRLEMGTRSVEGTGGHLLWGEHGWQPLATFAAGDMIPGRFGGESVLRCSPTGRVEPVWNLEVEGGPPEYLADGILCHNCADLLEELAAWRELEGALANAELGRSLGPHPRAVASTTPRNRAEIRALKQQADAWQALATLRLCARILGYWPIFERSQRVILTRATTDDNPYIAQAIRDDLYARYGGSRLGKQELEGELLTDVGTMFSRAWFRLIDTLPAGRRPRVRYWDLAATVPSPANEDPDWTAGALVEMDRTTRTFYVLDVERFRASPGEVAQRVEGIARIDGPDVAVVVEQDPGQAGKDQVAQYKERLRHTARVHGERPTGSKALRALLTATAAEAGRVHLLRGDWNLALLDEHEEFTDDDSHAHDDQVDSLSGALAVLERGLGGGMSAGTSAAAMTHGRVLRNGGR